MELGVNAVVLQDNRVLLTLRDDLPVWCLPGGAVEAGESLMEAAVRETQEETGIEVAITRIVGVYSRPHWRDGGNHEVVFMGRPVGGSLQPQDGEATAVSYFALDALPDNLLWWHRERVFEALQETQAVARTQDARWPLPNVSYREARAFIAANQSSVEELVRYFCHQPDENSRSVE